MRCPTIIFETQLTVRRRWTRRRPGGSLFRLLLFVLLAATGLSLNAMEQDRSLAQYAMRQYKTEQGLPENEVRSIAQTPDGYLWFGTRDGLARFDGVQFTIYRAETTPGIGHNMFGAMLVDRAGRLWIATGDGLSCYERGHFRRYTEKDGLPANAVHSLLEDQQGNLWVGTWNGLAVSDANFQRFVRRDGLPGKSISGLAQDGHGGIWVGTYGGGLAHLIGSKVSILTEKDGLPADFIQTILHDRAGRLWVGTLRGSTVLTASGKLQRIPELPGKAINFYQDSSGTVWAATEKTFGCFNNARELVFKPQQGPNQAVETMFEDRDGSLWVGTSGAGVARYHSGVFVPYTTREGLADDRTSTVFQDSRGNIWIGALDGLTRKSAGGFTKFSQSALGGGAVRSITEDDTGLIWIGTSRGISRFDGHRWVPRDGMPVDVHVLFKDRANRIWMGSPEGITVWDHGRMAAMTQSNGLPGNYVMSILEDRDGSMWIGTITGLAHLEHGEVKTYTTRDGLSSNYIQCLYQDSEGTIWVCTPSGLNRLREGRIHSFSAKDGLPADSILQLLEDGQHRFWMSSYRGIFRISREDLEKLAAGSEHRIRAVAYGTEDGMKSVECGGLGLQPAGWKAQDGTLWFPTDAGVVSVNPANLPSRLPPPVPVLEGIMQDGIYTSSAVVEPEVRRIDFVYTAPSSIAPEAIEFRYSMEGYENEWHEAGNLRRISFTNLPQGTYRFVLSARREGADWSSTEAASTLRVRPRFYQAAWFYMALLILSLMMIWLWHSVRVRATEQRLRTIMGERSRVAQELHDTLLQSVSGTAMEIRAALQFLSHGAAEVGMKQMSLALDHLGKSMAEARQAIWDLRSPETIDQRLDRILGTEARRICAGGPELDYEVDGDARTLKSSLEKNAYRIGVEAVTNAVRHSGCSKVYLRLHYKPDSLLLFVHDDGIGFDNEARGYTAPVNHWGLSGMIERAHQCSGDLTIESTPGAGTIIQFEAPV